jgi:hypothetical protein
MATCSTGILLRSGQPFLVSTEEIRMSNSEDCAYQEMLRGCEESLFSQQVGEDDETELESEE